ncbi:MAG TPA: electron transfer flavoprotein subunit alpha/FixB family protein [Candidatus Acidoferrales bacterium]|nr:electron transfer flavoprotein subunit alpha/FixB family protein [Candidatus Acidoferrales bacterium]
MAILVFIEQREGRIRPIAHEALGAAVRLAGTLGGPVVGVCCAASDPGLAALGEAGADRVLLASHEAFANYDGAGFTAAIAAAVAAVSPALVLVPASALGKDLAPRIAALTNTGLAADCVALEAEGGRLVATRAVYAGKARLKVTFRATPAIASLRPKMFAPPPRATGKSAAVEPLAFTWDAAIPRARVTGHAAAAGGKLDVTEAEIVVSGGRGLKGPEHFALVEALADALGASVGASRAVVDAGWRPHGDQVGQTGKTVAPKLYVAVGISGAIQHLAGMSSSKCIVAINKDPDAPIFKVADYGIVGDLFEVVPALTTALRQTS